jgi:diguanylate cyclase (GGDEF)-like protein/PAS domain S-box-containing protein
MNGRDQRGGREAMNRVASRPSTESVVSERRAQFDRSQFNARMAVVAALTVGLVVLPEAGPNGPLAGVLVGGGAGLAHLLVRWITKVPNPTGWLDLVAVVTATAVAAVDPVVWPAALLFQMLVLGGAVSFLPPRWTIAMGCWSVGSMAVVGLVADVDQALSMLIVAGVFLPVLISGALRKQSRIRRQSLRMEAVAESLPMVVWEYDLGSGRMGAVVGRTHEVFGRSIKDLLDHGMADDVHPDDATTFRSTYRALADGRGPAHVELEYRYVRPDGRVVWLRDRATVTSGQRGPALRGVTIDISQSRATELDLDRHRQIVERMPALTIVVDQHGARSGTVVQVVDPIGWGATTGETGVRFVDAFPCLAAHAPLSETIAALRPGEVADVAPWQVVDLNGTRRTVEVEVFSLPGDSIALLVDDVTEREAMLGQVRHAARHDDLTGLLNRAALLQASTEAIDAGSRCTLLLVDLNDFKSINDTLGHLTGDHYLADIARRLDRLSGRDEFVTRLGGDEFAVLLVDPDEQRVAQLVDDVVAACREPITLDDVTLAGSASVGVAHAPGDATSAESLLRCADLAMYHAKSHQSGASRYAPSMERSTDPLRLLGRLGKAFDDHEFVMHYQPQVDALTGKIVAFEALARWQHPDLGTLAPDTFLDLIAVSGHLDTLGAIAVRQASMALAQLPDDVRVSINVTAQNLRNLAFPSLCRDVFAEVGVALDRLVVEVTESHMLDTSGVTHAVIGELAGLGVRVSVDDFGTGYSSLTHLRQLPLSELKIDRRFVHSLLTDDHDLVIVRSMIDLGHNLGLAVVAEGVEDAATLTQLRDLGCDVAQGYHLGRPEPLVAAIARCGTDRSIVGLEAVGEPATVRR